MAAYTTIDDSTANMQAHLYTGTGASHAITLGGSTDLSPGLVMCKVRNTTGDIGIGDVVRGTEKILFWNGTAQSATSAQFITNFGTDGFTVGTLASANGTSNDFVSWNWKTGTTTGITGGDITPSSYSINAESGFGMYAYSGSGTAGDTIAHGLGTAPQFIFVKCTTATTAWVCGHHMLNNGVDPFNYNIDLNSTAAAATNTAWNDTAPTSALVSLGDSSTENASGSDYQLYAFAPVQGYSHFGRYIGNGNTDGTLIYTGFRPQWILLKTSSNSEGWYIIDDKRDGYNSQNDWFQIANGAEVDTQNLINIYANGFKCVHDETRLNGSGYDYIYAAFAHSPFSNSNGVPNNAR